MQLASCPGVWICRVISLTSILNNATLTAWLVGGLPLMWFRDWNNALHVFPFTCFTTNCSLTFFGKFRWTFSSSLTTKGKLLKLLHYDEICDYSFWNRSSENNTAASNFKRKILMCMQLKCVCRFANVKIFDYICKEHIP